jgi:hypothetical protein
MPASSTRTQPRPRPSASSRRNKGDRELKRLVELNRSDFAKGEEKRAKVQADTWIEVARIQAKSQERMMDKRLQMKREESETQIRRRELQRELQREREERQRQMFQGMIVMARSNHTLLSLDAFFNSQCLRDEGLVDSGKD